MAAEGAQVWATDVNARLLESYAGVANVTALALDVLDKAAIHKVAADVPALDILFNCAGFVHNGTILQATDEEWDFAFNLNVRSQYWMIQAALPEMLAHGGGSIINMASVCQQREGPAQPFCLRRQQGRRGGPDEERGRRFCRPGDSLQRHRPGHGGYALAGRAHQQLRRSGRGAQELHRAPAHGAAGAGP